MNNFKSKSHSSRAIFLTITSMLCLLMSASVFAQQYARPVSPDISIGPTWEASSGGNNDPLWPMVDEVSPNDSTDFILSGKTPGTAELTLSSVTDPSSSSGHIIKFRILKTGTPPASGDLQLWQGSTQIGSTGAQSATSSWTTFSYTLSSAEADAITDYSALSFRVDAAGVSKNNQLQVTWMELEVPNFTAAVPTVIAPTATNITDTTATLGGNVSVGGGSTVTSRGVEYGTSPGTYGTSVPAAAGGTGVFTVPVSGLGAGTTIYFRAWAINSTGTGYSTESSFTTLPTVSAPTFADVTDTTATLGGTVASAVAVTNKGIEWGTSPGTYDFSIPAGSGGTGAFTQPISSLPSGTVVYFHAWAVNAGGTGYSGESSFTTKATVSAPTFSAVTDTTATLGGTVSSDGGVAVAERGTVWGIAPNPTGNLLAEGSGNGTFTHARTGLPPSTLIYFRAYAINAAGTSYSPDGSFTTQDPAVAPTVTTPTFSSVTDTTAVLGGNVTDDGGAAVTDRGTVWGTSPNPTGNALSEGSGTGTFSHARTGLPAGTLIYFRAYATNAVGTSYSADGSFTTLELPTVDTPTFTAVTDTTATLGGTVSNDGGTAIIDRGTVWGTSPNPTGNPLSEGSGTGTFSHARTGLPAGTLIYFRAYATNSVGTAYSADGSFTTDAGLATVTTPTFADVTDTTATLGGNVTNDGGGAITDRGTVWGTSPNPSGNALSEGSGTGAFSHGRTGLPEGTLIYFRAYAVNSAGTAYSPDGSFTTLTTPTVDTPTFADVTDTTATLGGTVSDDGGAAVTDRGTVWGTSPNPTGNALSEGSGTGAFTHARTGLPSGTLIYFRGYATNSVGTSYSADATFTTLPTVSAPTFADVTDSTATLGGTVASDGGLVTDRGTVWGTSPNPTGNSLSEGSGNGSFTHSRSGLPANTLIYFRAYAINDGGTAYSADGSFTTDQGAVVPTVNSPTVTDVTASGAKLGGTVTDDGGDPITERGTVWSLSVNPDVDTDTKNIVPGTVGLFTGTVGSLNSGVRINYRAYATNGVGTGYTANDYFYTEPANSAASVTIDTVTASGFRVSWPTPPAGDGDAALVLVRESSAVAATPVDGVEHAFDTEFGLGTDLGTQEYVVYRGSDTSVNVSGLTEDTTYHVAVFYSAGSGTGHTGINYKQSSPAVNSQITDLGTTPPIVESPTATSINYFSAVLGGTISSDGNSPITQRGTVWNTTGAPIIENQLAEGGTATGAFSHTRINLPRNTTIWFRAYATNADGTSYSADASFDTASEPDVQASNIAFNLISANSMRITWTKGNGEGSIVVIRETATGRTDPGDGTDYVGDPNITTATQLPPSSGNFVVYKGNHNAVQVHGLSQNTSYTIAVYTYAGSGASIDYLQVSPAEASQSTSDLPVHNTSYGADCADCHNHGGGGFVPRDAEQQAVCETCHHEFGVASAKLNFAIHTTSSGDIDCGSCHEIHNPNGSTTSTHPLAPNTTTHNQSFIRSNVDKYVTSATSSEAVYQTPVSDLAIENASASEARGICQSCHTGLSYYNHDGSGDQCHDGAGGNCDPITDGGVNCVGCHTHDGNFMPTGGGSCLTCHNSITNGGPPAGRRAVVSEFSMLRHHVSGTLAESDCEVCHAQSGAGSTSHTHQDGMVTLWNVDDHNADAFQLADNDDPSPLNPFDDPSEAAKLTTFCLTCHDTDGAAAEGSPLAPFSGSGAPPPIDSGHWGGSSHNTGGVSCFGDGTGGCHGSGHGSEKLGMLAPYNIAATAPDFSEQREGFCFECHSAGGMSSLDIEDQFVNAGSHTVTSNIGGAPINTKHDVLPSDQTYSSAMVTCKNCHQQHINTNAAPVADPDTALALPTYDPARTYTDDSNSMPYRDSSNDQDVTKPLAPGSGYENPADQLDYIQFCLACHDGVTPPGVTLSAGLGNIAVLYESDHHGAIAGNTGSKTGKGILKEPWNDNYAGGDDPSKPYSAQNCTTCHGPHGGPNIFNLRASISVNGQPLSIGGTGASFPGFSGTTYILPTDGGVQRDHYYGAWCTFCHTMDAHPGKGEADACTGAHEHGGGSF